MSIEPITIPMSIESNEVTIDSTFDARIEVIEGGSITVQSLTVLSNGTTTAPEGKAYSPVIVNVPNTYTNADEGKVVKNGALASQTSTTKNANGTYDTTTNNQVTVAVPASAVDTGTKNITSNGNNQDVVGYAAVNVSVPNTYSAADEGKVVSSGALVSQTSDTVTTNDTYDTTLINSLTVNVSGGGGGSRLPSGYTEVDFVYANGTQYIEVDYVPVQNDHISTRFIRFNDSVALFSAGTGTYQLLSYGNYYRYFSSGSAPQFSPSIANNKIYELEADSTATAKTAGSTMSNVTSSYAGALDGTNKNLNIGRRANNSSYYNGYIYEFKITNGDTVKVDLIPCIQDSTQKAGMYDIVSDTFYSSNGTNEFSAGPESLTDTQALNLLLGGS